MKVILGGDTHGQLEEVEQLVLTAVLHEADGLFVLGDFGVWDHADGGEFTRGVAALTQQYGIKVWFLPGNHENYRLLDLWEKNNPRDEDGFVLVHDHLRYSPRGHRWTWDGVSFLSMGGAYSVDKTHRIMSDWAMGRGAQRRKEAGVFPAKNDAYVLEHTEWSWWEREEITDEEAEQAAAGEPVHVMLAHDKPFLAEIPWNRKNNPACIPNQKRLQQIVDAVRPRLYCHGHFHYPYATEMAEPRTLVKGFDCDEGSSAGSGGTGDFAQSWGLLDLAPSSIVLSWESTTNGFAHSEILLLAPEG